MNITRRISLDDFIKNIPAIFAGIADRNEVVIVENKGQSIKLQTAEQEQTEMATASQDTSRRLSDEEVARGLKALAALRNLRAHMVARHGGKPFAESWEDIRQDREERSKQWL
jgi:hypothetical protein